MLTIREPIKAWHCTWGRLGHSRALLSEKVLRGEYTSERGGCHGNQTSFNGGEDPGGSTLVLLVLALAACGSSLTKSDDGGVSVGREPAGVDSQAGSGPDLAQSSEGAASITEDPAALGDFGRKVVKTASLGLRSEDVRRSAAQAQQLAAAAGGTVLSSQVYRSDDSVTADLVLSIPSEEFERVVDELRSLGEKVTTDSISGQDVTEEYVDLKSRERNLRATEESLLRLYDRAENVEEALSIQRELTTVGGNRARAGQDKVFGSTQRLLPDYPEHPTCHEPAATQAYLGPWRRRGAGMGCVARVLQVMATAIISAVVFGWWLAPVLLGGFLWWRRRNRGSRPAATEPS